MDELYNMDVLSLAANIQHAGRLENPHGTARKVSKLCGSWVEVDVNIKDGHRQVNLPFGCKPALLAKPVLRSCRKT